jgi:hypothetical protein
VEGVFINIPSKIYKGRQSSFPPLAKLKVRDLSELKTQAIPLTYPKVGKNFAVLDIYFMGYL